MKWSIINADGLLIEGLNFAPFVVNEQGELEAPENILAEVLDYFVLSGYVLPGEIGWLAPVLH
jgi:hypothetical protein